MNRGDRGGKIFKDRLDYDLFLNAMNQVCERSGWRIHAYVLMPNHFHWLLETPVGNLVEGMKWFLSAYSMRFNARHGQRGHVFQGRYKAVVIDASSGNYFETVSTYIHLNPARANLLPSEKRDLKNYAWSSYVNYLKPKDERPDWLTVDRVLGNLELKDNDRGRSDYEAYLEDRAYEQGTREGKRALRAEWKPVRYGWCVGSEAFQEELLAKLHEAVEGKDRDSYSGAGIRAHDEVYAEGVIQRGMKLLNLGEEDLAALPRGHDYKCLLAWSVHRHSLVSNKWLANRLVMGSASNICRHVAKAKNSGDGHVSRLRKKLERVMTKYED